MKPADSLAVRKSIDGGKIPPVWLWSGPEEFLKGDLFPRLADKLVGEDLAILNVNRFRGGEDTVETVISVCRTVPMLSARRAVLLKDIERLSKAERELLVEYVARPAPEAALVLAGERGPRDSLHSRLTKAGAAPAVFWVPFEDQTRQWIQIRFRDMGKECDRETAQRLMEACGGGGGEKVPLNQIAPELDKIAISLGERSKVAVDDLDVIGRKADEALLYDMVSRVTVGDTSGALRALDGALLFKENHPVRIVATLTHRIVLMAKVRDLLDGGVSPAEAKREARVWPAEAWPAIERGVKSRSRREFERGLLALAAADRTLKSSSKNPRVVLEGAILGLTG